MPNDPLRDNETEFAPDRYRDLFEFAPVGYLSLDGERIVREANLAAASLLKMDRDELLGKDLSSFIVCEYRDACHLGFQHARISNGLARSDLPFRRADGSEVVGRLEIVPVNGNGPELAGYRVTLSDISGLREAEQEIRSLAEFPQENPNPVLRASEDGRVFYANRPATALLESMGWKAGELLPDEWRGPVRRVLQEGGTCEFDVACRTGRVYSVAAARSSRAGQVNLYARDVTERHRAEAALRASEQRLRQTNELLDAVTAGTDVIIAAVDADLRHTYFNKAYHDEVRQISGKEIAVGMSVAEVFADMPEQGEFALATWRRTLSGERNSGTIEFGDPQRRRRTYHVLHTPLCNEGGGVVGAGVVAYDITEQKRTEDDLRQSRGELDRAQEVGQIGWWRLDTRRNILTWSEENHRIFGVPKGTPLSYDTFLASLHPDDRAYVDARWAAALRGEPYDIEHRIVADGQVKWVREKAYLEFDGAGRPLGGFGITQDITVRKRSEERVQLLAQVTAELLASDEPQRIVEALCRRVMEHLGCHVFFNFLADDEEDCLRLNACAGISDEAAKRIARLDYGVAVCGCVAREGRRIVAEHIQTTSDPRTDLVRPLGIQAYACHPLLIQGRTIGTLSFGTRDRPTFAEDELELMRTVTDHVAIAMQRIGLLESSERHARESEAANAAKSRFLAHMSHELRTPMNAILGMTDLVLREELSPSVRDCLQTARRSADGLMEVLNEILDFSRIEAGAMQLEPAAFDLRETVDQTLKMMRVAAGEKGLELNSDLADAPTRLVGDSLRLRQVLLNLLSNAVKFTSRGSVTLCAALASRESDHVVLEFSVADTGIGIAPEDQDKVFSPFIQADASTTRLYGGTGLGLAIAARLVELMGGRMALASQPGKGTTICFTARFGLQAPAGADEAQPTAATNNDVSVIAPMPAASLRVLVAEDTPASRKYADYVLSRRGHRVTLVADGQQALEAVSREDFDVVLMDVQMPVLDGLDATRALRKLRNPAKAHLPVVAVTAYAAKGDAMRCLSAGMNGYLSKPIDPDQLIATVERMAEQATQGNVLASPWESAGCDAQREALSPTRAGVFCLHEAVQRCFGQYDLFRDMVAFLSDEAEPLLAQLRAALAADNAAELEIAAHRLKGTVGFLGAAAAMEAAQRVEQIGRRGQLASDEARKAIDGLEEQLAALGKALAPHRPVSGRV